MLKTIERYNIYTRDSSGSSYSTEKGTQQDAEVMLQKIELLETSKRKLMGESLESCELEELHELEHQLEQSICRIRGRKNLLLADHLAQLTNREKILREENAILQKAMEGGSIACGHLRRSGSSK
ncbi:hypothetical protein HPP92_004674 [Vanilla planifolia]|uniref:K-box domain-containing protein n=1 Tax=Vanilla planifolia TaxID=51239 RepID=A0A835RSM7_VANPL|nr:hypothetical protein HPP92_004674 [Vanilla planifolia]